MGEDEQMKRPSGPTSAHPWSPDVGFRFKERTRGISKIKEWSCPPVTHHFS